MELKILAFSNCASSCSIVPLPVDRFFNKLVPNVPNKVLRNPPFCFFASFLFVLLTPFNNKPNS